MLPCGHPEAYLSDDDADEQFCRWCLDRVDWSHRIDALKCVLHKKAVVVKGGSPSFKGPIGLLEIQGGTVHIETMIATTVKDSRAEM